MVEIEEKIIEIPTKEEIMMRLETLPTAIKKIEERQLDTNDEINNLEIQRKVIENRHVIIISTQRDKEEKKVYKNQDARDAAINERLKQDNEFRKIKDEVNKKSRELKEQKIGYFFLDRKFKAARTLANMMSGEGR